MPAPRRSVGISATRRLDPDDAVAAPRAPGRSPPCRCRGRGRRGPAATATAEPELDPPDTSAGQWALGQAPYGERVPTRPVANWSRFVLPSTTAPAPLEGRHRGALVGGSVGERRAARGGRQPGHVDVVLHREGEAGEGLHLARGEPGLHSCGLRPGLALVDDGDPDPRRGRRPRSPRGSARPRPWAWGASRQLPGLGPRPALLVERRALACPEHLDLVPAAVEERAAGQPTRTTSPRCAAGARRAPARPAARAARRRTRGTSAAGRTGAAARDPRSGARLRPGSRPAPCGRRTGSRPGPPCRRCTGRRRRCRRRSPASRSGPGCTWS